MSGRIGAFLLTFTLALTACGSHQPTLAQTPRQVDARASASRDSSIYAAFFETVNRDPLRDTIFVEELSAVFPGVSPHYDSVVPGLGGALEKASNPRRPTASLHLPPPIRILPDTTVERIRRNGLLGTLGGVKHNAQGTTGLWRFSPIVYSANGKDAMFSYTQSCGTACGETTLVWARKDPGGKWDVVRTAILVIY
jgi:hypothetical protein